MSRGAHPVNKGPAVLFPLSQLVIRVMPEHEGGPWLEFGHGNSVFADTCVRPGLSDELRAVAAFIDNFEDSTGGPDCER